MPKAWRFTYENEEYREADLTLQDAHDLCAATGLSWHAVNNPLLSPQGAWSVLAGLHSRRTGKAFDEVAAALRSMHQAEFLDLYTVVDDDLPTMYEDGFPQPADGTSTDS